MRKPNAFCLSALSFSAARVLDWSLWPSPVLLFSINGRKECKISHPEWKPECWENTATLCTKALQKSATKSKAFVAQRRSRFYLFELHIALSLASVEKGNAQPIITRPSLVSRSRLNTWPVNEATQKLRLPIYVLPMQNTGACEIKSFQFL